MDGNGWDSPPLLLVRHIKKLRLSLLPDWPPAYAGQRLSSLPVAGPVTMNHHLA